LCDKKQISLLVNILLCFLDLLVGETYVIGK